MLVISGFKSHKHIVEADVFQFFHKFAVFGYEIRSAVADIFLVYAALSHQFYEPLQSLFIEEEIVINYIDVLTVDGRYLIHHIFDITGDISAAVHFIATAEFTPVRTAVSCSHMGAWL